MLANYTGVRFGCQLNKSSTHRPHRLRRSDSASRRFRRPSRARHNSRTRLTRCPATDRLSFYSVLGVTQDATLAEIKSAFRRLAKQWHPDHNASAAAKPKYQVSQFAACVHVSCSFAWYHPCICNARLSRTPSTCSVIIPSDTGTTCTDSMDWIPTTRHPAQPQVWLLFNPSAKTNCRYVHAPPVVQHLM